MPHHIVRNFLRMSHKEYMKRMTKPMFTFGTTPQGILASKLHDKRAELGLRVGRMKLILEKAKGAKKAKLQLALEKIIVQRDKVEKEYQTALGNL